MKRFTTALGCLSILARAIGRSSKSHDGSTACIDGNADCTATCSDDTCTSDVGTSSNGLTFERTDQ